jgi:hypothetical protein
MRLPGFIIGGAPRAGTTWLYHALERHPSVFLAKPVTPEPKFFLVDHLYARGLAHYSQTWFADAAPDLVAGEKSTDYLESAAAAERIARDAPHVRLVFILRDPIERAFSNYLWTKMNGLEHASFEEALALEEQRERELPERWRFARPFSYFSRGLYADLLAEYFGRFPREQILVLRFEDIIGARSELVERLHRFLGVAVRPADGEDIGVINPSEKSGLEMSAGARDELRDRYAEPNRRLAAMLGPEFGVWR